MKVQYVTPGADSEPTEHSKLLAKTGTTSTPVAVINLIKYIYGGAGMLSLPWAMSKSSLIPGIVGIIFCTTYSCITCLFVLHACERTQIYEYSALLKCIHPLVEGFAGFILIYVTLSTLLSYYILIGDFTTEAIYGLNPEWHFKYDRQIYISSVFLILLLPLSLIREFKSIQLTSMLGNITTSYAVVLILVVAAIQISNDDGGNTTTNPTANNQSNGFTVNEWNLGLLIITNVVSKAGVSQYAIPPMYEQLKHRTLGTMQFVIIFAYSFNCIIYVLFAVAGYSIFGKDTQSDIFNNFENGDIKFIIARLGWNFSCIGSFPIAFKSSLQTIENKFFNPKRGNKWNFKEHPKVRLMVILSVVFALLLISLVVQDVGPVSSIEGAVTILFLVCICPILMAWKIGMVRERGDAEDDDDEGRIGGKQRSTFLFVLQVMLMIGVVLGTGGIVMQLYSLNNP